MGEALIVMVVGEEQLPGAGSWRWGPEGREPTNRPPDPEIAAAWWQQCRDVEWQLPREPDGIARDPAKEREHREAVRASLEAYVNARLVQLDGMVRTGRWVMGRARVRVELDP